MAYEQRDNSGSAFKNSKKTTQNHPDLTGKAMIGGVMFWMSIWKKTDKNGNVWLSHSFKEMEENGQEDQTRSRDQTRRRSQSRQQPDDDPPW